MKKIGVISTFLLAATAMTLASCGGGQKQKAFVSFAIYGDNAAVFTKAYDGQPAAFAEGSVTTNSDGQLTFLWQQADKDEEGNDIMRNLESAPVEPGNYFVEVSVPETAKFTAAKTGHDYQITKAALPEAWITWGTLPEVLHFTQSGSGNNTRRTPNADEVAAIQAAVSVNDGNKAWVLGTDFNVDVAIASGRNTPANGTITVAPINNPYYNNFVRNIGIALEA